MKVVKLEDVLNTDQHVKEDTWESRRLVLKKDGMGYSVHDTIIKAGTETHIWYKNHLESVYCIEGEGEVETVADGKVWPIKANEIYVLDKNDEHYLRAYEGSDMRMVCVFNPPITGQETHDENGVYALVEDE
ncbi:ectoine synthase [Alkalicoccus daliensis]|uniref:L-ectoine synthase n=1 Tax=Alkalicoccus daliensis TaxID=745820 RepID=A0A1H0FYL3_9BACI|nr:ectoine synthase [Alkalicoccus daliensis]SDN99661.1 ectoine synthase [Alkalicoccus daliensis]